MKRRLFLTIVMVVLCITTFLVVVNGRSPLVMAQDGAAAQDGGSTLAPMRSPRAAPRSRFASTVCAMQPEKGSARARTRAMLVRRAQLLASGAFPLSRFRQESNRPSQIMAKRVLETAPTAQGYVPKEEIAFIDPTNYGDRFFRDINGNPANLEPLIVLHETVGSASSAVSLFQTFHQNDDDQVSYHTLVKQNGTLVYLVPPDKRAFGSGNSVFVGENGAEIVKTNPTLSGSVNNFAYHISLETPSDGNHNGSTHSGYTQAQYQTLAWLVAKTGVSDGRITTHKAVDRSRSRIDPRSFNDSTFFTLLQSQPRTTEIAIRCADPASLTNGAL